MIRFSLQCDADHQFDSWFANGAAYETLAKSGQLSCAICGSSKVEKSLMVPSVRPGRQVKTTAAPLPETKPAAAASGPERPMLSAPSSELEQAVAALRKKVEENSEYVGGNFVKEARRMHDGDAPERAIYGEAKPEEARQLLADGINVAPLPFIPARKTN